MRKVLFIFVVTVVYASLAQAQGKPRPNLAGKWIVDLTKSETTTNSFEDSEVWMIIEQHEPEIRMVRKYESVTPTVASVYYTDGREGSFNTPDNKLTMKTQTRWDGDKLVIHYIGTWNMTTGTRNINTINEYKLSKDGNTLTKKIIVVMPRNAENRINSLPVPQANQEFK